MGRPIIKYPCEIVVTQEIVWAVSTPCILRGLANPNFRLGIEGVDSVAATLQEHYLIMMPCPVGVERISTPSSAASSFMA
jgi:hypothetical protein